MKAEDYKTKMVNGVTCEGCVFDKGDDGCELEFNPKLAEEIDELLGNCDLSEYIYKKK